MVKLYVFSVCVVKTHDLIRKICSLMGHLVLFWWDWQGMITDLTICSKKTSASPLVITGGNDLRLLDLHRLVSISHCSLTVKLHYQHCHPKPTLLMYKSSLGPDYHSVLATSATVALFLLTAPSFSSSSPLLFFLQVSFCTHKNGCQVHTLHALSQTNQIQVYSNESSYKKDFANICMFSMSSSFT